MGRIVLTHQSLHQELQEVLSGACIMLVARHQCRMKPCRFR